MHRYFQRTTISSIPLYEAELKSATEVLSNCRVTATRRRARTLSRLAYLMCLDPVKRSAAMDLFHEVEELAGRHGYARIVATNRIRHAIALQFSSRHQEAIAMFDEALIYIKMCRLRKLNDFALQHKGKCLVEMGAFEEAMECFKRALCIRRRRNEPDLIQSTEQALSAMVKLMAL